MKIRDMVFTALFAAIICVIAPFKIPIGEIPITLATFAIYIIASVLNWKQGTLAVIIYIALGAAGVPVFAGFVGGIPKLIGPTGGFILGYIPLAIVIGLIVDRFESHKWSFPIGMVLGTVFLYACGAAWFAFSQNTTIGNALAECVAPFLIFDGIKIVLASVIVPNLRKILKKQRI